MNCTVSDCRNPKKVLGYCVKHYAKYRRTGKIPIKDLPPITKHPLYPTYSGMKRRCYNAPCKIYKHYGAKGIKMESSWLGVKGFWKFVEDMGPKPEPTTDYSIDRINPAGDYSPDNCRWANPFQQALNRRTVSSHPGVSFVKKTNKYQAYMQFRGRMVLNQSFDTFAEAMAARTNAEAMYHY